MVHVFENHGQYYIFDTGSASLHACDETAALLLKEKLGQGTADVPAAERRAYEEDFAELEREGLLFAP